MAVSDMLLVGLTFCPRWAYAEFAHCPTELQVIYIILEGQDEKSSSFSALFIVRFKEEGAFLGLISRIRILLF